jgi:large repetitive protein
MSWWWDDWSNWGNWNNWNNWDNWSNFNPGYLQFSANPNSAPVLKGTTGDPTASVTYAEQPSYWSTYYSGNYGYQDYAASGFTATALNADAHDNFSFGFAAGSGFSISGSTIYLNGAAVASFTGGAQGTPLSVSIAGGYQTQYSTIAALMDAVRYTNDSPTNIGSKTVQLVVSENDGSNSVMNLNVTFIPATPTGLGDAGVVNGYVNAVHDTVAQTVTGHAEAGGLVAIYDRGVQVGSVTADASGNWTFNIGQLPDGSHSVVATVMNSAGIVSAASAPLNFTVDTLAPSAPSALADAAQSGGYVNASHDTAAQTLTGHAEAGSTVTVYDGTTKLGTATANGSGAWSFTLGVLQEGSHSLTASATDAAGNVGVRSAPLTFTVDTHAPGAPTSLADLAVNAGYVNASQDTASQALTGTAEAGSTVTVYDGTSKLGTTTADATGAWSYTVGALADGDHSLTATATDAAGNVGTPSAALVFSVDTQPPVAPTDLGDAAIVNGFVNATNDTAAQVLTGTAEAGSTVTVYDGTSVLGTAVADASGAWNFTLGSLADGDHSLTATATDAAGNVGAPSAALTFTVDTQPPAAPAAMDDAAIVNGFVGAANDTAAQVLTGTAEAGSTVAVYDGTTALGTAVADASGAWTFTLGSLSDGSHSLTATATDAAGNVGAASTALTFTVDTQPPAAPTGLADAAVVNGFVNGVRDTTTQALTGTAEAGSTVTVYDGATKLGTALVDAAGAWSFTLGALADGDHSLTATATDPAGNVGAPSAALAFTVDTQPPAAPAGLADAAIANGFVNAAHDTAAQALVGTAEAGSTVTVYDGTSALGTAVADASGAWSFTLGQLGEGDHSLTATATDAAGNVGAPSAALAFTVDTQPPAAPEGISDAAIVNGFVNGAHDTAAHAVTGTAEAGSTVTVYDGTTKLGTTTANASGAWTYTLGVLAEGGHSLTATAADAAGNVGVASTALAFSVDTQPPVAPAALGDAAIVNGFVNAAHDTTAQVLTGTAEAGSTVTVYDGTTKLGVAMADASGAWTYALGSLTDGAHSLTATATDAAGNVGAPSAALAFVVDTQPPAAPSGLADAAIVGGYVNAARDTAAQTLTGTAEAGATVLVYDGNAQLGTAVANASGAWSYALGALSDGTHSLTAIAVDAAGNAGVPSAALAFTVDTAPPVTTISNIAPAAKSSGAGVVVSGSTDANSEVTLWDGTTLVGTANADASGHWSIALASLSAAVHSLHATGVDSAGNAGSAGNVALFGTKGNDTLVATGAENILFGNGGNNSMTASAGADQFVFQAAFGHNNITGFDVNRDVLVFDRSTLPSSVTNDASLLAYMLSQSIEVKGTTMITSVDQGNIVLVGVAMDSLTAANFHILG